MRPFASTIAGLLGAVGGSAGGERHAVDDEEHVRVCTDAQTERERPHGGEAGIHTQLAEGEFEVIHIATPPSDRHWQREMPE